MTKRRYNILLVEDNLLSQKVAKIILSNFACEIDTVLSGEQALSLIRQKKYDLVLMDIGLYDIDGFEVTKKIRSENYSKIPIIGLTANSISSEVKKEASSAGMNDILSKPLTEKKCKTIFKKYL